MITAKALAACLLLAAQTHHVPPAVMVGILQVEGGRVGQQVLNTNGSYDLGPMQVNTIWLPELARIWNTTPSRAHKILRDDGCTNMNVAAWILRRRINDTGSLFLGIAHYHSATPALGHRYAGKVIAAMDKRGLILHGNAKKTAAKSMASAETGRATRYLQIAQR